MKEDKIETYIPCEETLMEHDGIKKRFRRPVINSLMFFRSTVRRALEVQRQFMNKVVLYTRQKKLKGLPLTIPEWEMDIFMLVTSSGKQGMEYFGEDNPKFYKGERVRVIDGEFKGAEEAICRIRRNSRLVVTVRGVCAVVISYILQAFLMKLQESERNENKLYNKIRMKKQFLTLFLEIMLFTSCNTSKKILYFQDIVVNQLEVIEGARGITVQPKNQISITVSSKDPQLAALFNLTRVQYRARTADLRSSGSNGEISGYTLDDKGNIDFPAIGTLYIAGTTKSQIATPIKRRLIAEDLVKDPVVTVEFMNLYFSALGEAKAPGRYNITKDQITLLEAISMAGDLTITGKHDVIFVIREENGERVTHWVDPCSKGIFRSPAHYLKQNDVIYVQPNKMRAGQNTINENDMKSVSLWVSIASFLTSLGVLIFK